MASFRFQPPRTPSVPAVAERAAAAREAAALVSQRSRPRAADAILTSLARAWFESLPMRPRPEQLCARYPRVANRMALCWPEFALTEQLFDDLLGDRRGGRKGVPAPVLEDLRQLRLVHAARREAPEALMEEREQG